MTSQKLERVFPVQKKMQFLHSLPVEIKKNAVPEQKKDIEGEYLLGAMTSWMDKYLLFHFYYRVPLGNPPKNPFFQWTIYYEDGEGVKGCGLSTIKDLFCCFPQGSRKKSYFISGPTTKAFIPPAPSAQWSLGTFFLHGHK